MKHWLALVSGVALVSTAGAGTVVHVATRSSSGAQHDHEVYYAQGGMLRVDHLDEEGHVSDLTLIRDGAIWRVDVRNRTFEKFDNQGIKAQMSGMDERMKAMLDKMPPEKRAALEQRFQAAAGGGASAFEFTDTGHSDHSGSYSCELWSVSRAGREIAEDCLAQASAMPGGAELADSLDKAVPVVEAALAGTPMAAAAQVFVQFKKARGFPVRVRHMAGGKVSSEDFVSAVETPSLPADEFAIPKGFTEKAPRGT